jgi:hypothetical protein
MSRLLVAVAVAALLVLVGAFVPVGGRTALERWNGAPSASGFAERTWNDVVAAWDGLWGVKPAARPSPRPSPKGAQAAARPSGAPTAPQPVENHTDEDRKALDRIVAEHARDARPGKR